MTDLHVFSVPMELHVVATTPTEAIERAHDYPGTVYDNDNGTSATLIVATDKATDVDRCE